MIPRIYEEVGQVDQNGINTLLASKFIGWPLSGYHFPNFDISPAQQVDQWAAAMSAVGIVLGTDIKVVYIDVEEPPTWPGDCSEHSIWIAGACMRMAAYNIDCAIYTSSYMWGEIGFCIDQHRWWGNDTATLARLSSLNITRPLAPPPLWYASWDGQDNFNNWQPFADWTSPFMKQYQGDASLCGVSVDLNWTPF